MTDPFYTLIMENIASQPTDVPSHKDPREGLYRLIDTYKACDEFERKDFTQALKRVFTEPQQNPEILVNTMLLASALKVWSLETEVRQLSLSTETPYIQEAAKSYLTGVELSRAPSSIRASTLQSPTPSFS